jgi:hypothetical protein
MTIKEFLLLQSRFQNCILFPECVDARIGGPKCCVNMEITSHARFRSYTGRPENLTLASEVWARIHRLLNECCNSHIAVVLGRIAATVYQPERQGRCS